MTQSKTVSELIENYLRKDVEIRLELLRLIGAPGVVISKAFLNVERMKNGTLLQIGKWGDFLVKNFDIKTGFRGLSYIEITLQNNIKIRESKGKYGFYLREI